MHVNYIDFNMGVFKSEQTFQASTSLIPIVVSDLCDALQREGFEVQSELLTSGGAFISITKGSMFKAVLGLKTALKITLIPTGVHSFSAEAGVGVFGQQAIPTALTMLVAWPVMIPQIWGLIQQSKLDEHILELIQHSLDNHPTESGAALFCPQCGHKIGNGDRFCGGCGTKI
jgi:hypothetical protein